MSKLCHVGASTALNIPISSHHSKVQSIDPRARIVCAFIFALIVVLSEQIPTLVLALLFSLAMAVVAQLPFANTIKKMAAMDAFMLYLLLMLPFSVAGDSFFTAFGFSASWQGLEQGIKITLKANAVVLLLFATVSILPASVLGAALISLQVSNKLVQLLLFTLNYINVIAQEFNRLRRSMKARAFVMKFNWHTWKSMAFLIAMMLIRSLERSERVLKAMKCRGYKGVYVSHHPLRWRRQDSYYCLCLGGIMLLMVCLDMFLGVF